MIHEMQNYKNHGNLGEQLDAIMHSARELETAIKKEKAIQKNSESELIQLQKHYEKELQIEKMTAVKAETEKRELSQKIATLEKNVEELKRFSVKAYEIMKQNRENQIILKKALGAAQTELHQKNKLIDFFGKKLNETYQNVNFIQGHVKKLYDELPSQGLTKEALMDETYRKVLENISQVLDQRDIQLQNNVSVLIRNNFMRLKEGLERNLRVFSQKITLIENNLVEDRADVSKIKHYVNAIGQKLANFTKRPYLGIPSRKPPEFTK